MFRLVHIKPLQRNLHARFIRQRKTNKLIVDIPDKTIKLTTEEAKEAREKRKAEIEEAREVRETQKFQYEIQKEIRENERLRLERQKEGRENWSFWLGRQGIWSIVVKPPFIKLFRNRIFHFRFPHLSV